MTDKVASPDGSALSEGLGPDAEMPPWLLPMQEAVLIANTHRVRAGAVQAIAKTVHRELAAENERLRAALRRMEAAGHELRVSNERWGLTERRKKAVSAWGQAVITAGLDFGA